jgi:UDP-N-acetylmuramate dehydrogenase
MRIEKNYSLLKHNTFGLDVKTKYFVEYESEEDLQKLLRDEYFYSERFWHIGQGSNLLFLGDFNGIIVHSAIRGTEKIAEDQKYVWLKTGAGTDWDSFVEYCVNNGWGGVENLSHIPGEAGASAVQNIGAYGVEAANSIEEVHAWNIETGDKRIFTCAECEYAYRESFFKKDCNRGKFYITHVVYRLSKQPEFSLDYGNLRDIFANSPVSLQAVRNAIIDIRRSKLPDPKSVGNAGSFFVNPNICTKHFEGLAKHYPDMPHFTVNKEVVKIPAAWLIDKCGFKGKIMGNVAVHDKQPLVLINRGNATGAEIAALAEEIRLSVRKKFDIELQPEVNYI